MPRETLTIVSFASMLCAFGTPRAALAQEPPAEASDCAAAYEAAQTERQSGRLKAAAQQAMTCSRPTCNQTLVQECIALFESIQAEIPSMVFSARRADGGDLVSVRVEMDGQPLLDHLDGKAVPLDPGAHTFKFIAEGFEPKVIPATARIGDRNRLVEVVFGETPVATPAAPPPVAVDPGPPRAKAQRSTPVATYVLAGVSAAALGTFAYLKITALNDYNTFKDECSPACNPEEVDDLRTKDNMSWIALGLGAVTAGAAVAVYFATDSSEETPTSEVGFGTAPGGGMARFRARF